MSYVIRALGTLLQFAFSLYLFLLMLRFLFQLVRADFYNPLSQAIVRLTNPPLKLLRRFIPGYAGVDWPCVVLLILVQGLEILLLSLLFTGHPPNVAALLVLSIADLLQLCAYLYIFFILIIVVISWVNPGAYNSITVLLYQVTDPLLRRARRLLPDLGGLDFSPMLVMLVIYLFLSLVVAPLRDWGNQLIGLPMRIL